MRTFDFHSIDLNSYLYREKLTLAAMATALGNRSGAAHWRAEASALLPILQQHFYKPDAAGGGGFFQDRYFNGSFVAVQGCEGYAALFCGVATAHQAVAVAKTLSDTKRFLLNFSLPTASAANPAFNPNGYWKGSTWLDQVWFAYTGLKAYGLHDLAENIKGRTLSKGRGFQAGDSTPLNEHCRFFARV